MANLSVTPELLDKDPYLLLHKRGNPDEPLHWCDGRVGAVLLGGFFFVTSPNMDVVYEPPLGKNREMFLRRNYRYADDDPLLWPQPYLRSACHYGAILREPEHSHTMDILWWDPTPKDLMVNSTDLILGIGKVPHDRLVQLRQLVGKVQDRVQDYKSDKNHPVKNIEVLTLSNWLQQGISRLELLPMDFSQLKFCVAEVQRAYLELTAGLDYLYIYKPRIDGNLPPATEVAQTIGVFTTDSTIVQEFTRAGLPVWFLRPANTLSGVRIDSIVEARKPCDFLELQDAETKFNTVFRGSADDPEKRKAFALHSRRFFSYYNPFTLYIVKPRANTSKPELRETNHQAKLPIAQRAKGNLPAKPKARVPYRRPAKSGGRNKFLEMTSPLLPPTIPVWSNALAAVNTNPNSRVVDQTCVTDGGYAFPEPGLFIGCATEEKRTQYLHQWLRHRAAFIYRLSSTSSSAQPLHNQMWRDFLNLSDAKQPSGSNSTKASKREEMLKEILGNCLHEPGVELAPNPMQVRTFWRECELATGVPIQPRVTQEILYELFSLNFRFELLALHSRAQSPEVGDSDDQDKIAACFPEHSMLVVELSRGNIGLVADRLEDRLPYLLAIKKLMSTWIGAVPEAILASDKPGDCFSVAEIEELERQVARFYTQSFFNFFGRAAIVPRRLI